MKAITRSDNLIQLVRMGAFNCYLVREDDGYTLVDTNLPGSAKSIVKSAEKLGATIKRIVITHAHSDHAKSVDALHAMLPDAEILWSTRTARFLSGDMTLDADEPQAKLKGSFITVETEADRLLNPGDRVGSLKVVAAPGHTPDQIALLDTRDRTIIAADAFQTRAGLTVVSTVRWLFPFPAMATWHAPTAVETAKRLHGLNPSRLAVGHGPVIENPGPRMAAAIVEAERRQAKTAGAKA